MIKTFFDKIDKKFVTIFNKKVLSSASIVISSHKSPDDDSISSVLSIHKYLTDYLNIAKDKIKIIYTGDRTSKWKYFPRYKEVHFVEDIFDNLNDEATLIIVDGSSWDRFSRKSQTDGFDGYTICIDHHPHLKNKHNLHIVDPERTSVAEMIYKLFYANRRLDKEICELLMLGILGDTGNFRFLSPQNADVFTIAGRLTSEGGLNIDSFLNSYQKINEETYSCLINLMRNSEIRDVKGWPKFLTAFVSRKDMEAEGLDDNSIGEASQIFTTYLRSLDGVDWGFVVTPRSHDNTNTVSFRSSPGSVCVRKIAEDMKIGGGHDRAAGGKIMVSDANEATK
ncbi:MAG TPA: DHH family phosphoesterase [Patescibacteria group bacterium]|nr:DHH family phosphoesterase [Patescibacteria group bacterium]